MADLLLYLAISAIVVVAFALVERHFARPRLQVARGEALDRIAAVYNMKRLPATFRGVELPWRERDATLRARVAANMRRRPER